MNWFGEPWPSEDLRAAVCEDDADRVPAPAPGELCTLCDGEFAADDRGVVIPHLAAGTMFHELRYVHLDCIVQNVGG